MHRFLILLFLFQSSFLCSQVRSSRTQTKVKQPNAKISKPYTKPSASSFPYKSIFAEPETSQTIPSNSIKPTTSTERNATEEYSEESSMSIDIESSNIAAIVPSTNDIPNTSSTESQIKSEIKSSEEPTLESSKLVLPPKTETIAKALQEEKPTVNQEVSPKVQAFFTPSAEMSNFSTVIEIQGQPIDADYSYSNISGHLGLCIDINRSFFIGPYFRQLVLNTSDYQVFSYKGQQVDVSSLKEWGAGIATGTYIVLSQKLILTPELRVGYNEYTMFDQNYTKANQLFINNSYISFFPKLNAGIKMSNYSTFGGTFGYQFSNYFRGNPCPGYNPSSFNYGFFVKFYLPK